MRKLQSLFFLSPLDSGGVGPGRHRIGVCIIVVGGSHGNPGPFPPAKSITFLRLYAYPIILLYPNARTSKKTMR